MKTVEACILMLTWSFITPVRSHPLGQISAGARASLLHLFDGTREIFDRTFVKTGNVDNAIKDFYATQPTDIQTYYFPFGGKALEGRLGENTIVLRTTEFSERNRPTIRIYSTKSNEMMRKLVYSRKKKEKENYMFNQGSLFQR